MQSYESTKAFNFIFECGISIFHDILCHRIIYLIYVYRLLIQFDIMIKSLKFITKQLIFFDSVSGSGLLGIWQPTQRVKANSSIARILKSFNRERKKVDKVLAKIRARVWGCNREREKKGEVNKRKRVMTDGDLMRGRRLR